MCLGMDFISYFTGSSKDPSFWKQVSISLGKLLALFSSCCLLAVCFSGPPSWRFPTRAVEVECVRLSAEPECGQNGLLFLSVVYDKFFYELFLLICYCCYCLMGLKEMPLH